MKKAKILIVDDDPVVCRALKEQLLDEGYQVTTAFGGRQALQVCQTGRFRLAFVNLIMDPMDGVETIKRIKQVSPVMKTVLMSGAHDELKKIPAEFHRGECCEMILNKPVMIDIGRLTRRLLKRKAKGG